MKKLILNRYPFEKVTFGKFDYNDFDTTVTYDIYSIELPWANNQNNISCIPQGLYNCIRYNHPNKGWVWRILNVPYREGILIHAGNFACDVTMQGRKYQTQTQGCIMPGCAINKQIPMVTNSKTAMNILYSIVGNDNFCLEVKNG